MFSDSWDARNLGELLALDDDGFTPRLPCPGHDSLTADSECELPSETQTPVQLMLLPIPESFGNTHPVQGTPLSRTPSATLNASSTAASNSRGDRWLSSRVPGL